MLQSEYEINAFRHEVQKQDSGGNLKKTRKIGKNLWSEDMYSHTIHIALDAILNLKLSQAKQKGILATCNSNISKNLELDPSDLMVMLGNLLDNAITVSKNVALIHLLLFRFLMKKMKRCSKNDRNKKHSREEKTA